jgi:hypothetical protein
LRGKLHGASEDGERIFLADTVKRGDGPEHGSSPKNGAALELKRTGNANARRLARFTCRFNDLLYIRRIGFAAGRGLLKPLAPGALQFERAAVRARTVRMTQTRYI